MKKQTKLSYNKEITPLLFFKMVIDPLLMITTIFCLSAIAGEVTDPKYYVIAMIIFALGFPGQWTDSANVTENLLDVIGNWAFIALTILFFGYATGYLDQFPKQLIFTWLWITPIIIFLVHYFFNKYLAATNYSAYAQRKAVVVGMTELGAQLKKRMVDNPDLGLDFKGFFEDRDFSRFKNTDLHEEDVLGKIETLPQYIRDNAIDTIYIALPMTLQPRMLDLLDNLKDTTVSLYYVPDIFMFDLIQARIDDVAGIPVVAVCETPFSGMNGFVKRVSDVILSTIILVLISPILLLVAIGVKLTSKGPVLFKQKRYGLDAEEISVYKFRSMTVTENGADVVQATKNDSRITPFGGFLRRTSLDELPQFINVLQGRMSIVGPRPHAIAHNEMYRKVIKGYMIRHKVKPGITGWAQINGFRGETETVDKMEARIQYDLDYLRQWSLPLDLKIIMRTVLLVFKDSNAY